MRITSVLSDAMAAFKTAIRNSGVERVEWAGYEHRHGIQRDSVRSISFVTSISATTSGLREIVRSNGCSSLSFAIRRRPRMGTAGHWSRVRCHSQRTYSPLCVTTWGKPEAAQDKARGRKATSSCDPQGRG